MQILVQFRKYFFPFLYPVIAGFLHSIILKLSKKAIKYIKDKSLCATKWQTQSNKNGKKRRFSNFFHSQANYYSQ